MAELVIPTQVRRDIDQLVEYYLSKKSEFDTLAKNLHTTIMSAPSLRPLIHSSKLRTKAPEHLRNKLERKATELIGKGKDFNITTENIFKQIEDLAGVRLLHLHTKQMEKIHPALQGIFHEHKYHLIGKPVAYSWDKENEAFFKRVGMTPRFNETYYTSVHYIVKANRRTDLRCELQVRTLMEEVWGEVSHTIDYPIRTESVPCQEQLKVLARMASGCTRLVDSIFASYEDHKARNG